MEREYLRKKAMRIILKNILFAFKIQLLISPIVSYETVGNQINLFLLNEFSTFFSSLFRG